MASFSSKYNKQTDELNRRNNSRNRQRNSNQKQQNSNQGQRNSNQVQQNNNQDQRNSNQRQLNTNQIQEDTNKLSYKTAVNNLNFKTITLSDLDNSVELPDTYNHKQINKINDINQLMILKEMKWGDIS